MRSVARARRPITGRKYYGNYCALANEFLQRPGSLSGSLGRVRFQYSEVNEASEADWGDVVAVRFSVFSVSGLGPQ